MTEQEEQALADALWELVAEIKAAREDLAEFRAARQAGLSETVDR